MRHVFLLLTFFLSSFAYASPVSFVFQGQIVKPNGSALEASNVDFRVGVLSTSNSCLLYEETFTLNMSNSEGVFNLSVGNGAATANGNFQNLKEALDNTLSTLTGLSCGNGTAYTPSLADTRRIRLTFDDGSGPVTLSQDHILESIPYAQHADELQGHVPEDFLKTNGSTAGVTQVNLEQVFDGGSNQAELLALIGGSSNQYSPISANGAGSLPSFTSASPPSAPSAGDIWLNSDTGDIIYYNGSTQQVVGANAGTVTSVAAGTGLSGGTITGSGTISLANQGVDTAQLANDAVTTAQILNGTITGDDIAANTIAAETKLTSSCTNNQILQSNGSGNFVCANLPTPPSAPVISVYGRVGVVTAMSGDYAANQVVNTAAGSVAATNVQAAINELDTEKLALAGGTMTGAIAMGSQKITGLGAPTAGTDAVTKTYVDAQVASAGDNLGDHEADQNLDLANNLLVGNGGTSGVAITSGGNVGIGTTNSSRRLSVRGVGVDDSSDSSHESLLALASDTNFDSSPVATLSFQNEYLSNGSIATMGGVSVGKENVSSGDRSGYMTFSTSDSSSNPSEKVRITSGGSVGIGTTSPNSKLHIRRADVGTGLLVDDNSFEHNETNGAFYSDLDGFSGTKKVSFLSDIQYSSLGRANYHFLAEDPWASKTLANNDPLFYVYGPGDVFAAGNVGIGTTLPTQKLDVNGNIKGTQLCIGTDCRSAWPGAGGGGTVTSVAAGTGLSGGTITGSGTISLANQGVDTAQLANDAVTTAQILNGTITGDDIAVNTIAAETKLTSSCTNNQILQSNGSGNFVCANAPSAPVTSVYGRVGVVTAMSGDYAANQVVNTAAGSVAATNVQAAINELGAEKLALAGGAMTGAIAMGSQKITGLGAPTAGTDAVTKTYVDAQVAGAGDDLGDHTATQNIELNGKWLSGDGGNEGIFVANDGKVGIGTSSPVSNLVIKNNVASGPIDNFSEYQMLLYKGASAEESYGLGVRANTLVFNTNNDFDFDQDGETVMTIDDGKVGIGTAVPERVLHIVGNGGLSDDVVFESNSDSLAGSTSLLTQWRSRGTNASKTAVLSGDGVGLWDARAWNGSSWRGVASIGMKAEEDYATEESGYLYLATTNNGSTTEKVRVTSTGNVGIGTTSPDVPLHVAGAVDANLAGGGNFILGDVTSINMVLDNNEIMARNNGTGSSLYIQNDAGSGKTILNRHSGNVGIGTTSPAAKLDVAGEVKFGNTASTCNSTTEGQQRYNSTNKKMEFCNGTTWTVFASGSSGNITSCPSGWTMIGDSGKNGTYCIDTNERIATPWFIAKDACGAVNDASLGQAHLCTHNEWYAACKKGTPNNMTGNWEWIDSLEYAGGFSTTVGSTGCSSVTRNYLSAAHGYRCCLH